MSMTRDEAIAELLCMAEQLASYRKSMLTAQKIEWEAEDLAEIKAALAEPLAATKCSKCGATMAALCADCFGDDEVCAQDVVRRAQAVLDDPQIRPRLLALAGVTENEMIGADLSDWFCHFFNAHGGHDGCATVVNLNDNFAAFAAGDRQAREEITRALEAVIVVEQDIGPLFSSGWAAAMQAASRRIRDGSIREWLPKEKRDAE